MLKQNLKLDFHIFKMNCRQLLLSKIYIAAVILLVIVELTGLSESDVINPSVTYKLHSMLFVSFSARMIVLISSFPVAVGFCNDWNTQNIKFVVARTGVTRYLIHKVITCVLGSFLAVFISFSIFGLILGIKSPLVEESDIQNFTLFFPFGYLVKTHPFLHLVWIITVFSAYTSVWSVAGLAVSTFIPNRYIAGIMPLGIYTVFRNFFYNTFNDYGTPAYMMLPDIATGFVGEVFGNPWLDCMYIAAVLLAIIAIFASVFILGATRRIRNEAI